MRGMPVTQGDCVPRLALRQHKFRPSSHTEGHISHGHLFFTYTLFSTLDADVYVERLRFMIRNSTRRSDTWVRSTAKLGTRKQIFIAAHRARRSYFASDIASRDLINDRFSTTCTTGSSLLPSDRTELYFLISILISKIPQTIFRYNKRIAQCETCFPCSRVRALVYRTLKQINIHLYISSDYTYVSAEFRPPSYIYISRTNLRTSVTQDEASPRTLQIKRSSANSNNAQDYLSASKNLSQYACLRNIEVDDLPIN
jgi:hypothetical protein